MMNRTTTGLLAAGLLLFAQPITAQNIAFGVGGGWARVSCDVCQSSRDLGPTAFLRVGTSLRPAVRVGAELTAWTHEIEDERENLGAAMAVLSVHPREGPMYLKAGLGYVGYRAGDDIALNTLGLQLGAGYELRLGSLALNNYLNLISSSFGSLKNESTVIAEAVSTTLLQFGVGLTLR